MTVQTVPGHLIPDSRYVYNELLHLVMTRRGAEKRAKIAIKQQINAQNTTDLPTHWVHGNAQSANSLKQHKNEQSYRFFTSGHKWNTVADPSIKSASVRQKKRPRRLRN